MGDREETSRWPGSEVEKRRHGGSGPGHARADAADGCDRGEIVAWYPVVVHHLEAGIPLHERIRRSAVSARTTLGWSRDELALRSGTSHTTIARFERDASGIALGTAGRILDALGARVELDPPILSTRIEQRDAAHASCVEFVRRRLARSGFVVATEVEIGNERGRGWIDVLAFHPASGALFLDEVKSELRDVGALQRQIGWYEREVWRAAASLGWRGRVLVRAVTVLFTAANDAAVRSNAGLYGSAFPLRAADLQRLLDDPGSIADRPARALALIDPLSRRRVWLRPTMSDGRRSPPPYADYADFMRHLRTREGRPKAR